MQSATGFPYDRPSEDVVSPAGLAVSVSNDPSDFSHLRAEWETLRQPGKEQDPFLSSDWFSTWWRAFGGGHQLYLITIRRHGRLCAILPLMLGRSWFHGIPIRRLGAIGNDHTPHFDMVRAQDDEPVYRAVWNHLMAIRNEWDVVDLPCLSADKATIAQFVRMAEEQGVGYGIWQTPTGSPWIALQSSWHTYMRSRSSNFRKALGRKMRRLEEQGNVTFETVTLVEKLGQGFADASRIEAEGWKGREGTAILSQPAVKSFYSEFAKIMAARGQLRLHFLTLNGERIAFDYSIIANRCLYSLKAGYGNAHARYSPGTLLLGLIVRQAHDEGLAGIDLMGEADEFKMHWTDTTRPHPWLHCYSGSFRGRLIHALRSAKSGHGTGVVAC